jgi:membrane protease subunit HflK
MPTETQLLEHAKQLQGQTSATDEAAVNPGETLRDLSEAAMREVVGDRTVDELITIGRQDIEIEALPRMQELSKRYNLGIRVDQVQLKNVNPPSQVQASFNEVNKAQQDRENAINIANGEYNKVVPKAKGEADQTIRAAEGYRFKRVNEAEGDVAAFNAVLQRYIKAPEITRGCCGISRARTKTKSSGKR